MEYIELTIKIPVIRFRSLRFSVKSLLILTFVAAVLCGSWSVYRRREHARLLQQVKTVQDSRTKALQNWKRAADINVWGTLRSPSAKWKPPHVPNILNNAPPWKKHFGS
jgi:hypothetical protein